ncbi:TVP38/TMEM64 family protein [Marixanthomonas spongiae]|uniref:TVP38/TMEM64 family membrane protein n=1 Tax=Marixanthomonas spongiae TaxID=2174845 RepID=A0A2U0HU76_9FLAO|nr:TVP38/TMEM64 family protein [Marixanthomonas spongiae]PVW12422.1 TVP38/TMEM64 family protein [Marixanthomonas spongiae]
MSNSDTEFSKNKGRLPIYISIALLSTLVICYFTVPSVEQFFNEAWNVLTSNDEKRIEEWVSGFGWLGPVVLVLAMVVQMFLIVIPTLALMVVSVLAYGPVWGSLIIFVSVFTASSVGYVIGRYLGQLWVEQLIGRKTEQKIENFIEDYGFWAVVITRINPFLSNDAISFVAGILKMGYWRFIGATMLGIAPLTLFVAIVGQNTESLKSGLLWGSLVCLVIFGAYVYWDKKK